MKYSKVQQSDVSYLVLKQLTLKVILVSLIYRIERVDSLDGRTLHYLCLKLHRSSADTAKNKI